MADGHLSHTRAAIGLGSAVEAVLVAAGGDLSTPADDEMEDADNEDDEAVEGDQEDGEEID